MVPWIWMVACDADNPAPEAEPSPLVSSPPAPTTNTFPAPPGPAACAAPANPVEGASVDLSPAIGACTVQVVGDLGGDGADDVVGRVYSGTQVDYYYSTIESTYSVLPDVIAGADEVALGSPASDRGDYALYTGLMGIVSTPDATGDGVPDVWLEGYDRVWNLVPGPVTSPLDDPTVNGVATMSLTLVNLATDLDADGVADLFLSDGHGVHRCTGPFAGALPIEDCPAAQVPGWGAVQALSTGDVDADGVEDVLASVEDIEIAPGKWTSGAMLTVFDGTYPDGTTTGRITVTPEWAPWFEKDTAALGDFDGDGYADLVWADESNVGSVSEQFGEVAIVHGPIADGADLHLADATLHLTGAGDGATIGAVTDVDDDGVAELVLGSTSAGGPLLFDASVRGTVDPAGAAYVISASGVVAGVGEFDGDGRDDLVIRDHVTQSVWLFLGASLP